MPAINQQLFADSPTLHLRDVALFENDDIQTHLEKLARIVLDEMRQFVALLDANGNTLEINRAALQRSQRCCRVATCLRLASEWLGDAAPDAGR